MTARRSLHEVLLEAQRAGTLGARPIDDVIEHARQFVRAIPSDASSVIDIGSGGGVPGLVIAIDREDLRITMVDRRATRMDALTRAVEALGLGGRVRVITADASELSREDAHARSYDAAVCRGLGQPDYTAGLARPFLVKGGLLIVSDPPDPSIDRWPESLWGPLGFCAAQKSGPIAILTAC